MQRPVADPPVIRMPHASTRPRTSECEQNLAQPQPHTPRGEQSWTPRGRGARSWPGHSLHPGGWGGKTTPPPQTDLVPRPAPPYPFALHPARGSERGGGSRPGPPPGGSAAAAGPIGGRSTGLGWRGGPRSPPQAGIRVDPRLLERVLEETRGTLPRFAGVSSPCSFTLETVQISPISQREEKK